MEASTVERPVPSEPAQEFDGRAEATKSTKELFQWSTFVHVGEGAAECPGRADGKCKDELRMADGEMTGHFHAWLRLPNTFQNRDIQEKAFAAKARKRRALRQDGADGKEPSDGYLMLEEQIDSWSLTDDTFEALCITIANRRVEREYIDINRELQDSDEFEHHAADLEEFRRVAGLADDERDEEQWAQLQLDVREYSQQFEKRAKARHERELQILHEMPRDEVMEIERKFQIDETCSNQFLHTYYTWAYYACARKPAQNAYPHERAFKTPEALRDTAPEVLDALREAYRWLEAKIVSRGDAAGN